MDINCTVKCAYQQDGKCALHEVDGQTAALVYNFKDGCPYCDAFAHGTARVTTS